MKRLALALLWQDGDEVAWERAVSWSAAFERVYIIDLRASGESFASLDHARLHYAPFRQKTSLAAGLNRAWRLAYEEGIEGLGIVDAQVMNSAEELRLMAQTLGDSLSLSYDSEAETGWNPLRRPSCGLFITVSMARSLDGWNPDLPARQALKDLERRLLARGGRIRKGLRFQRSQKRGSFLRHFFSQGTKSR